MGKSASKPEQPPVEEKPVDKREVLTRNFGENYKAYWNRLESLENQPFEDTLKRPVHSSVYWRELSHYQGMFTYLAFFFVIMRKLPFTNPAVRVSIWLLGMDIVRSRSKYLSRISEDEINELSCFDLMKEKILTWKVLRMPDFFEEHEDWFEFNKPAYRVPIGLENNPDALARFIFVSSHKYAERVSAWHGEWEQENALVMDLQAPHADYWLTHH